MLGGRPDGAPTRLAPTVAPAVAASDPEDDCWVSVWGTQSDTSQLRAAMQVDLPDQYLDFRVHEVPGAAFRRAPQPR